MLTVGALSPRSDPLRAPDEKTGLIDHSKKGDDRRNLAEDVPFYSPPRQRQRWGEEYVLPHVNWGDVFFDLFYVAAAFNLDNIMEQEPSFRGLLYFAGCFLPIAAIWQEKLFYDSRFAPDDNLFHRFLEVVHLALLATIVQHVRPAEIMVATYSFPDTMIFSFLLFLDCLYHMSRYLDIYFNVDGGEEAKEDAVGDMRRKALPSAIYLGAAIIAGYDFFFLRSENKSETDLIPIILCLVGGWTEQLILLINIAVIAPLGKKLLTKRRVPVNLEFTLRRMGEWVMLMLGETVLNLLVVAPINTNSFYTTFYTGVLTVTMLQYLYFRSLPFDIDDHAYRRSTLGAWIFNNLQLVYSGTLILFGGSYRLMLDQVITELAHGPDAKFGLFTLAERRVRIANMFSWSLTLGLVALDNMLITHRGYKANIRRLFADGRVNVVPVLIVLLNLSLLAFTVTLSRWVTSLELLSVLGVASIAAQVLLRTLGLRYFPVSKAAMAKAQQRFMVQYSVFQGDNPFTVEHNI